MDRFFRFAELDRSSVDAKARTASVAFSSEYAVDRGDYDEILDHSEGSVDLSRLRAGGAVLVGHELEKQVGVVDRVSIDADKVGRATIRFSRGALGEEMFNDVKDGIRRHLSVGYSRTGVIKSEKVNSREVIRYKWMPYELSLVPVPADPTVGVGRGEKRPGKNGSQSMNEDNRGFQLEQSRQDKIDQAVEALCKRTPAGAETFLRIAHDARRNGTSIEETQAQLLAAIPGIQPAERQLVQYGDYSGRAASMASTARSSMNSAHIGMSQDEIGQYSILRAVANCIKNNRVEPEPSFELDCSQEVARRSGLRPEGFWLPADLTADARSADQFGARHRRDLNVTTGSQGGNFVESAIVTPIIEILRNKMVCQRLGAHTLTGLQGDCAIPRQIGEATAYSLTEAATVTKSTQAIDQIALSPKRVSAWNNYTKKLLIQSSVDVENFLRADLMNVMAIKNDRLMLEGQGTSNEPTGILHTTSIGSITFGGSPSFDKVVDFETALTTANADGATMAYVVSPTTRGKWKKTLKIAGATSSTATSYLWEPGNFPDSPTDGIVNGYRACSTNQISNNLVAFGNFRELILAMWGGFDIVVDPYTMATEATVRIVVNEFIDVAVRHAASFVWSVDAGNQ